MLKSLNSIIMLLKPLITKAHCSHASSDWCRWSIKLQYNVLIFCSNDTLWDALLLIKISRENPGSKSSNEGVTYKNVPTTKMHLYLGPDHFWSFLWGLWSKVPYRDHFVHPSFHLSVMLCLNWCDVLHGTQVIYHLKWFQEVADGSLCVPRCQCPASSSLPGRADCVCSGGATGSVRHRGSQGGSGIRQLPDGSRYTTVRLHYQDTSRCHCE